MLVETAFPEATVEALDECVLSTFAGLNEVKLHQVIRGISSRTLSESFRFAEDIVELLISDRHSPTDEQSVA